MPFSVGPMELAIVLIVALVILGPKRLPGAARSLGRGMREFKDTVSGISVADDDTQPRLQAEPTATRPAGD
jgi:sec-independent protein translocase protein TatA